MVEKIEEVETELNCRHLLESPILIHSEVRVHEIWTATEPTRFDIGRNSADLISNQRKGARVDDGVAVPADRTTLPCEQWPQGRCKAGLHKRVQAADGSRSQNAGVLSSTLEDSEIVTICCRRDATKFPAAKDTSFKPVRAAKQWQEVGRVRYEDIRTIGISVSSIEPGIGIVRSGLRTEASAGIIQHNVCNGVRPGVPSL